MIEETAHERYSSVRLLTLMKLIKEQYELNRQLQRRILENLKEIHLETLTLREFAASACSKCVESTLYKETSL